MAYPCDRRETVLTSGRSQREAHLTGRIGEGQLREAGDGGDGP